MSDSRFIDLRSIPFRREGVIFRKIEDEYILVPMYSSSMDVEHIFNLNHTGAEIWERIDGKRSVESIIEELQSEYENPPDQIEEEVIEFLQELWEAGLIEVKDENH